MSEKRSFHKDTWLDVYQCPTCRGTIERTPDEWKCVSCGTRFPVRRGVPDLNPRASDSPGFVGVMQRSYNRPDGFLDTAEQIGRASCRERV